MRRNVKSATGFTLLELLVVIAILGVLAALLFPSLKRAQATSRRTACANNLKQINLGVRMYSDDAEDKPPATGWAAVSTNFMSPFAGYKELMKKYVGLKGASSARDKLFACPADRFCPAWMLAGVAPAEKYVKESLHEHAVMDFSSYAFNGGDNVTRKRGPVVMPHPGLTGVALSEVKNPARTVLVAEASALFPWSWHDPNMSLATFKDAKNMVSFVDGHVSYIKIYHDNTFHPYPNPPPYGITKRAIEYDPPPEYDHQ